MKLKYKESRANDLKREIDVLTRAASDLQQQLVEMNSDASMFRERSSEKLFLLREDNIHRTLKDIQGQQLALEDQLEAYTLEDIDEKDSDLDESEAVPETSLDEFYMAIKANKSWNEQRITDFKLNNEQLETVQEMWLEGITARKISEITGYLNRNGIIVEIYKMGLSSRARLKK